MFGLFGPEKVEFIDNSNTVLTFRAKKNKHVAGTVSKVNLQVLVGDKMQGIKMEVVVDTVRQLPDGSYLVVSNLVASPEKTEQLVDILHAAPRPDIGKLKRRSERIPIGIRVLSQQIPGFRGVTVDISGHGAQIQVEGMVEDGRVMDITFELELSDCPKLTLRAEAIWCRGEDRRKLHRLGVEFTEQHPQTQVLWDRSYGQLLRMKSGSIMHRSMASDFTEQDHHKK